MCLDGLEKIRFSIVGKVASWREIRLCGRLEVVDWDSSDWIRLVIVLA